MRDYAFGNRLAALRQERGYSQFQLASLIGVSDKAVSKWETGAAKPRLKIWPRLAAVLGVDQSDFFGADMHHSPTGGYVMNKELLWKAAEERLYSLYGENPDLAIINRFTMEKRFLHETDAIALFSALARVRKLADNNHSLINVRGMTNGSFIAFLMGATVFNPLPAHTYCPNCQKIIFSSEASNGFDLPASVCNCGHQMLCDGHNLPFETYLDNIDTNFCSIDCNIPSSIISEAWKDILNCLQEDYSCDRYVIRQTEETGFPGEFSRLYLHPGSAGTIYHSIDEVPEISNAVVARNRKSSPSITLFNNDEDGLKYETAPSMEELLNPNVLYNAMKKNCAPEYYLSEPSSFHDLVQAEAASHATFKDDFNPVQFASENGLSKYTELPLTREEVWTTITNACPENNWIASDILHNLRLGRYARGKAVCNVDLISRMGLPDWFPEYLTSVLYLFPKSHCVDFAYRDLVEAWSSVSE